MSVRKSFWIFILLSIFAITANCRGKRDSGDRKGTDTSLVPSDWDGTTDWSGSVLTIKDAT